MPVLNLHKLNIELNCHYGETIFDVAIRNSVPLAESCGGSKICGHCRVVVIQGAENLSKPDSEEAKLMQEKKFLDNERLACSAKIYGDVKITTSYW
ncbi:MAG: 2Fe-2S iron-sulfur cluster-binding protein [Candidatus Kryptonium sp.]|nr:(2Fe-2S)-binding protein [Candidatus Kryptonium sp.]MDW8109442.1 2Fe-2S iron-sulfur cluster-binding protein [Candidatus Kryptonium sp.]